MDQLLAFMGELLPGKEEEVALCISSYLADKYEQGFWQVTASKSIAIAEAKEMDAHKVEAMLMLEANINTSSSRTRFRHLSQFLGKSLFEYKRKWQNQFCGQEFLHTKRLMN